MWDFRGYASRPHAEKTVYQDLGLATALPATAMPRCLIPFCLCIKKIIEKQGCAIIPDVVSEVRGSVLLEHL